MGYSPEYQKDWYERNKTNHLKNVKAQNEKRKRQIRDKLQNLKNTTPCTDCGVNYPYYVMQFDHVHGEKSINISQIPNRLWSDNRIDEEIAKCEIVCSNCHAKRTYDRANK